ncbi:hypothetical protein JCM10213_005911 [Rhodosporidiobolus nylandii]
MFRPAVVATALLALSSGLLAKAVPTWYLAEPSLSTTTSPLATSSSVSRAARVPFRDRTASAESSSSTALSSSSSTTAAPTTTASITSHTTTRSTTTPKPPHIIGPQPCIFGCGGPYCPCPTALPQPTSFTGTSYAASTLETVDGVETETMDPYVGGCSVSQQTREKLVKDGTYALLSPSFSKANNPLKNYCGNTVKLSSPSNPSASLKLTVIGQALADNAPDVGVAWSAGMMREVGWGAEGEEVQFSF